MSSGVSPDPQEQTGVSLSPGSGGMPGLRPGRRSLVFCVVIASSFHAWSFLIVCRIRPTGRAYRLYYTIGKTRSVINPDKHVFKPAYQKTLKSCQHLRAENTLQQRKTDSLPVIKKQNMVRFAEFFAGIGLIREAVTPLGWECVFANDIAPGKAVMYRDRFGANDLIVDDIKNLSVRHLPVNLHVVTASFPCTDLSLAGNRAGLSGKQSGTIWPFLDLIAEKHCRNETPSGLLLENVTGLLSSQGGQDLTEVCRKIAALGYEIDLTVVDARWFTPQSRPRLFVVGIQPDRVSDRPAAAGTPSRIRPAGVRRFQAVNPDIHFVDLPIPEPPVQSEQSLLDILENVGSEDPRWWPQQQTETLLDGMTERHRMRASELISGHRGGVAAMYRRRRNKRTVGEIRGDDIAGCLRTPQGGSSVQFLVDCRSGTVRIRPLTGVEYARLQGAGSFPINVSDRQARMGFGDAVCVPAVRWLAQHAFSQLS